MVDWESLRSAMSEILYKQFLEYEWDTLNSF